MSSGVQLTCSMCKNEFPCSIGYFRCESKQCGDFDLCVRCAVTGKAGPRAPHTEQLQCNSGHALHFVEQADEVETFLTSCKACSRLIQSDIGSYECQVSQAKCKFNLCLDCAQCPDGHTLHVQFENPYSSQDLYCDRCGRYFKRVEIDDGFCSCPDCDYDVCRNCVPKPKLR